MLARLGRWAATLQPVTSLLLAARLCLQRRDASGIETEVALAPSARMLAWSGRRAAAPLVTSALALDPVWKSAIPFAAFPPEASPTLTIDAEARMSQPQRRRRRSRRAETLPPELQHVHLNAAGIDIGAEAHFVAVPPGRDPEGQEVRQFAAFTADLYTLADWLAPPGAAAGAGGGRP